MVILFVQVLESRPFKASIGLEQTTQEIWSNSKQSNNNVSPLKDSRSFSNREQKLSNNNKENHPKTSLKELMMLNVSEFPYAILGSIGAAFVGIQAPLLAFGITYMLTAFYSNDESRIKYDVRLIAFAFFGVALVTFPICLMQHYFYTLMGERITTRVRLKMFSGTKLSD